ncbi:hypothetical protein [Jiangella alba]|nr:hypothetical protein [Jiangella alba]
MALFGVVSLWPIGFGLLNVVPWFKDEHETCFVYRRQGGAWDGEDEFVGVDRTFVPFSVVCRWGDGYRQQLVVDWLNPTVAVIVGLFGAALLTAVISAVARRRG